MSPQRVNALLSVGIIAGLLAIAAPWLTKHHVRYGGVGTITDGLTGETLYEPVTHRFDHVTGMDGSFHLVMTFPIWLIVSFSVLACAAQLASQSAVFDFPRWAITASAVTGALLLALLAILSVASSLVSGSGNPNIGWILGVTSSAISLYALGKPGRSAVPPAEEQNGG